jgi:hypothetical protein
MRNGHQLLPGCIARRAAANGYFYPALIIICLLSAWHCSAQVDPQPRSLAEFGYDAPLKGQGPPGVYGFYYYNDPTLFSTNVAFRAAVTPLYLDSEIGFKQLLSPYTDVGLQFGGGAYGDDYYEVQQGKYIKDESFYGNGGGVSVAIYQRLNPGMRVPLSLIVRGGLHYSSFTTEDQSSSAFALPQDQYDPFTRVGLRLAGKEPVLYPELAMEVSAWFERQWRLDDDPYGFNDDRRISPDVDLYWLYAGMTYTFKHPGQTVSAALTAGGSDDVDRLSAWRLGGMLPLNSEYPLMIPGYFNEELTAERFVHLYAYYEFPLLPSHILKFRVEGAAANLEYVPGFEQSPWQTGAGCALIYQPQNKNFQVALRYGYGFNAIRDGQEGAQSIGLLFQYDFDAPKHKTD